MIGFVVCLVSMAVLQAVTPYWWWIMVVPLAYGALFGRTVVRGVLTAGSAAGALWLGAGWYALQTGADIVAGRVAAMFGLSSPWTLLGLTTLTAVLASGSAALTGLLVARCLRVDAR